MGMVLKPEEMVGTARDMMPSYFDGRFITLANNVTRVLNGKSQEWNDEITPRLKSIRVNDSNPEILVAKVVKGLGNKFELSEEEISGLLKIYLGNNAEV